MKLVSVSLLFVLIHNMVYYLFRVIANVQAILKLIVLHKRVRTATHFMYLNLALVDLIHCLFPSMVSTVGLFNKRDTQFLGQITLDLSGWMLR